jgi:hypothetical protein
MPVGVVDGLEEVQVREDEGARTRSRNPERLSRPVRASRSARARRSVAICSALRAAALKETTTSSTRVISVVTPEPT